MKKPKLRLQTGHPVTADVGNVAGDRFRFVDAEDRTVFEVVCEDGYLEIRAVEFHTIGEAIHGGGITIHPRAGNSIEVRTPFYAAKQAVKK